MGMNDGPVEHSAWMELPTGSGGTALVVPLQGKGK
jgi:hypothetical protein